MNNFRYGYIRQGLNVAGAGTASYSDFAGLSLLSAESRSTFLNVPVHNFVDDVNWIKGKHTLEFGASFTTTRRRTPYRLIPPRAGPATSVRRRSPVRARASILPRLAIQQ